MPAGGGTSRGRGRLSGDGDRRSGHSLRRRRLRQRLEESEPCGGFGALSSCCTLALAALAPVAHARDAARLSRSAIPEDRSWRSHVVGLSDHGYIYAKHADVESGEVDNPAGLTAAGGGVTTVAPGAKLVIDLGVDTGGYVEIGITKNDGSTVHLGYSEARRFLTPDGDILGDPSLGNDDAPGSRSDDFSGSGDKRSPGIRGAQRWIALQLNGVGGGAVSIDYVRVKVNNLDPTLADYRGRFLSSDDTLNRIWYASAYTYAMDSYGDPRIVTDGGKRDRLIWIGDLAVEDWLGAYTLRQSPQVIHNSLAAFTCLQRPTGELQMATDPSPLCPARASTNPVVANGSLPEYTAWWVIAVHDELMLDGDRAFARRMLPTARRAMQFFRDRLDADGLYETPGGAVINWHPFDLAQGIDTHTNATIYHGAAFAGRARAPGRRPGPGEVRRRRRGRARAGRADPSLGRCIRGLRAERLRPRQPLAGRSDRTDRDRHRHRRGGDQGARLHRHAPDAQVRPGATASATTTGG